MPHSAIFLLLAFIAGVAGQGTTQPSSTPFPSNSSTSSDTFTAKVEGGNRTCVFINHDKPTQNSTSDKEFCKYCFRVKAYTYDEKTKQIEDIGKPMHEEAGCEDGDGPPVAEWNCGASTFSNRKGRDFLTAFRETDEEPMLIFKRCCVATNVSCNGDFDVPYYHIYLKKPDPHKSSIIVECICCLLVVIFGFVRPIYWNWGRGESSTKMGSRLKELGIENKSLEEALMRRAHSFLEQDATKKISGFLSMEKMMEARREVLVNIEWPRLLAEEKYHEESTRPVPIKTDKRAPLNLKVQKYHISNSTVLQPTDRKFPSAMETFILRLVEHGPYMYTFKPLELMEIFDKAKDAFSNDETSINVPAPIVVVGDIRGKYIDLHRIFHACGWPPRTKYLFLGGVLDDEEPGSMECIALIAALKASFPKCIFMLRGIREMFPFIPTERFTQRKAEAIGGAVTRLCSVLPVTATVDGRVLCVHSGLYPKNKRKKNPKKDSPEIDYERPCAYENIPPIVRKIVFGEPTARVKTFRAKPNVKNGNIFGVNAVKKMCRKQHLEFIVRSRTPIDTGFAVIFDNKLVNIWSCNSTQRSAVLEIHADGTNTMHVFDPSAIVVKQKNQKKEGQTHATERESEDDDFMGWGEEKKDPVSKAPKLPPSADLPEVTCKSEMDVEVATVKKKKKEKEKSERMEAKTPKEPKTPKDMKEQNTQSGEMGMRRPSQTPLKSKRQRH